MIFYVQQLDNHSGLFNNYKFTDLESKYKVICPWKCLRKSTKFNNAYKIKDSTVDRYFYTIFRLRVMINYDYLKYGICVEKYYS